MNDRADRASLGFPQSAERAFAWLVDTHSFRLIAADEFRVSYLRSDLAISVLHDRLSYELGVALARSAYPDDFQRPFGMVDLIRPTDPGVATQYRRFAVTTGPAIENGLEHLAQDFRTYGAEALSGNVSFFGRVQAARETAAKQFGSQVEQRQVKRTAEAAWKRSDYAEVVHLYEALSPDLTGSERARLAIARKRMQLSP